MSNMFTCPACNTLVVTLNNDKAEYCTECTEYEKQIKRQNYFLKKQYEDLNDNRVNSHKK